MTTLNKQGSFVLVVTIEGNINKQTEVKKIIDVNSICEISECDDYFGFKTTKIIFNNGMEPVYIKSSIEEVFINLKNSEKLIGS